MKQRFSTRGEPLPRTGVPLRTVLAHAATAVSMCLITSPAAAAFFCVDTATALNNAINASETNNEADEIRVVGGTYVLGSALFFQSQQGNAITIRGGYLPTCGVFTSASTVLDGQDSVRPLTVRNTTGAIAVEGLTFVNGLSTNNNGGGMWVNNTTGDIRIERNIFFANRADDDAGAMSVVSNSASVRVRNNLAFGNSGANNGAFSIVLNGGGEAYITGNTIVANSPEGSFGAGGLYIGGAANFTLSNNIIWNNVPDDAGQFVADFRSGGAITTHSRFSNDIGVVAPDTVADLVVAEQSVDPQFDSCGGFLCYTFELKRNSPLVDMGNDAPLGGMSTRDLAGKIRTIGPHVDIGAYENDLIFADGFD